MIEFTKLTLVHWLRFGAVKEPLRVKRGGVEIRLWTDRDVQRVRKYLQEHYGVFARLAAALRRKFEAWRGCALKRLRY
jgi:hypothetical protein